MVSIGGQGCHDDGSIGSNFHDRVHMAPNGVYAYKASVTDR